MRALTKEDRELIERVHKIYSEEEPAFITRLKKTPALLRLNEIGQNCGFDYLNPKLITYQYNTTRFDHSVGCALIVWHFTKDIKQSVAALFHDISTPTFSHVIDFLKKDYLNQESTEAPTRCIIEESKEIREILKDYHLEVSDVCDYKKYPVADNPSPQLSSDRLEYTYLSGYMLFHKEDAFLRENYQDITIATNEQGVPEMCFRTVKQAKEFANLALSVGKTFASDECKMAGEFLVRILKKAIFLKIICEADFMRDSETKIIEKIKNSKNRELLNMWDFYTKFDRVYWSHTPVLGYFSIRLETKKRYVNPLVLQGEKRVRYSEISVDFKKSVDAFLKEDAHYIYVDYKMN